MDDHYLQREGSISVLEHLEYIKDLGVTFDVELKFDYHINEKVNKSYSVLGLFYIEIVNICRLILLSCYKRH